ncbi:MAG: hypothetical protein WD397_04300 [Wenzhouxiangellaceae bacterium]
MNKPAQIGIQLLTWSLLGAMILAFSDGPSFNPLPVEHGRLTLAIAHLSERVEPCRQLSEAERMELPPTRRVTEVCERARVPVRVELAVNNRTLLARAFEPSGFHEDGRIYRVERWPLPAGHYRAELTLTGRSGETSGHEVFEFLLSPGTNAVVDIEDHEIRLLNVAEPDVGNESSARHHKEQTE